MVHKIYSLRSLLNSIRGQNTDQSFITLTQSLKTFICLNTVSAVPTGSPPADDVIGTTEVTVKFVNKESLSNGNPVRFVLQIKVLFRGRCSHKIELPCICTGGI